MARIFQSGFETNSMSTGVEWSIVGAIGANTSAVATRTGGFGLRVNGLNAFVGGGTGHQFVAAAQAGPYYLRAYLKVRTPPGGSNIIMCFQSNNGNVGNTIQTCITLESNRTLRLKKGTGTFITGSSAALNADTWYRVELQTDNTTGFIEAKLNGTTFASASSQAQGDSLAFSVGGNLNNEFETTGDWYWDDIALNDSTGSSQNGYPGNGSVIHLHPDGQGDANAFATQTGGTAGSANNWTRVADIAPDEASTFNGSATLNAEDLFSIGSPGWAGIGKDDTINAVLVGVRVRNNTADATTALKVEMEKTSGGTIAQGAAIIPNTTSFITNAAALPRNYPLVLHKDPDGTDWTRATLDTAQIGYKLTAAGTNRIDVTTVWASVDFTPVIVPNTIPPASLQNMGVG